MSLLENTHLWALAAPMEWIRHYLHHRTTGTLVPSPKIVWVMEKDCDMGASCYASIAVKEVGVALCSLVTKSGERSRNSAAWSFSCACHL